jgi:hypothetical protein
LIGRRRFVIGRKYRAQSRASVVSLPRRVSRESSQCASQENRDSERFLKFADCDNVGLGHWLRAGPGQKTLARSFPEVHAHVTAQALHPPSFRSIRKARNASWVRFGPHSIKILSNQTGGLQTATRSMYAKSPSRRKRSGSDRVHSAIGIRRAGSGCDLHRLRNKCFKYLEHRE